MRSLRKKKMIWSAEGRGEEEEEKGGIEGGIVSKCFRSVVKIRQFFPGPLGCLIKYP